MTYFALFLAMSLFLLRPYAAWCDQEMRSAGNDGKTAVLDVIPLTAANLRGHKMLYNEGWFIVTSSSKAFDYAKEKSVIASKTALQQALQAASHHGGEYQDAIKDDVQGSVSTGRNLVVSGTKRSGRILETTHDLAKTELGYARDSFKKATAFFVKGNLSIASRTEEERRELANLPGNYFHSLKNDFSNIYELSESARERFAGKIDPAWEKAFKRASREFQAEYEKSGTKSNTLLALGPVLSGYLKAFYHGLAAPASKTIVKTAVGGATTAVFLPVSATAVVAGRTIQSVGLTVYYAAKTGVKIVSPTIEGGLLSGLSLLSLTAVPVTYAAGGALGAVNQVAFTTAGPAVGTAQAAATATAHTAAYAGVVTYDALKGATKVVINQTASGLVLGYNALTAIPTHALLGVVDSAVFLAWDGPRLVIAAAGGRIKSTEPSGTDETHSLGDLPVGTVVDLNKLQGVEGVKVEILSTDSAVIQEVIEKIPGDARTDHATER